VADVHPELVWLALDSENAYCTLHRAKTLEAVEEHLPALRAYAVAVLGRRSQYLFWDARGHCHRCYAREGVEQGDPLSPLLFGLTVRTPLARLRARLAEEAYEAGLDPEQVHVFSYLDDLLLAVPGDLAQRAYELAEEELATCGLQLNRGKCKAWSPGAHPPPGVRDLWAHGQAGLRVLGTPLEGHLAAPLGSTSFAAAFCAEKAAETEAFLERLAGLAEHLTNPWPAAHLGQALLRYSGPSRATYLLRILPPETVDELAARVDAAVARALEKVCHWNPLRPAEAAQVRLPRRDGGEGFTAATTVAPAA